MNSDKWFTTLNERIINAGAVATKKIVDQFVNTGSVPGEEGITERFIEVAFYGAENVKVGFINKKQEANIGADFLFVVYRPDGTTKTFWIQAKKIKPDETGQNSVDVTYVTPGDIANTLVQNVPGNAVGEPIASQLEKLRNTIQTATQADVDKTILHIQEIMKHYEVTGGYLVYSDHGTFYIRYSELVAKLNEWSSAKLSDAAKKRKVAQLLQASQYSVANMLNSVDYDVKPPHIDST